MSAVNALPKQALKLAELVPLCQGYSRGEKANNVSEWQNKTSASVSRSICLIQKFEEQ